MPVRPKVSIGDNAKRGQRASGSGELRVKRQVQEQGCKKRARGRRGKTMNTRSRGPGDKGIRTEVSWRRGKNEGGHFLAFSCAIIFLSLDIAAWNYQAFPGNVKLREYLSFPNLRTVDSVSNCPDFWKFWLPKGKEILAEASSTGPFKLLGRNRWDRLSKEGSPERRWRVFARRFLVTGAASGNNVELAWK